MARNIPDDVKNDIAGVARSLEIRTVMTGGRCFWRALVGYYALELSGISAHITLGGMVYRAGPNERRDVVAFCGPGNFGIKVAGGLLAHYFLMTDAGEIVDFSAGDWKRDNDIIPEVGDASDLGPIQWMVDPPLFHWDAAAKLQRPPGLKAYTPQLGRAWYNGFEGDASDAIEAIVDEQENYRGFIVDILTPRLKSYDIVERIAAHRSEASPCRRG